MAGCSGSRLFFPVIFSQSPAGKCPSELSWPSFHGFHLWPGLSVGALIVTGLYSAWAHVTVIPALVVPYGQVLVLKTALVGVLLVFGATNLLWLTPAIRANRTDPPLLLPPNGHRRGRGRSPRHSRRGLPHELGARSTGRVAAGNRCSAKPVLSRHGGRARTIDVEIEPGQVGPNTVTVTLTDRLGSRITNASGVDVRLTYLDADLGEGLLSTEDAGEGEYRAADARINIAGPYQLEVAVRRPDTFDARTAFRFEVGSGGGVSSSAIFPSADTGRLLFGIELAVLGFMLLAVGIPLGGWYSRRGLAVMTPGLAVFMIGAGVVFTAQFGDTGTSGDRSPFPPNPESLTIGAIGLHRDLRLLSRRPGTWATVPRLPVSTPRLPISSSTCRSIPTERSSNSYTTASLGRAWSVSPIRIPTTRSGM